MPMAHGPWTLLSKFLAAFCTAWTLLSKFLAVFCARVCRAAKKCLSTNLNEEQDVRSSVRLCELPDEILWHILSFLQLKDVVRTSTLSKRWEHLSRSNPRLDISERDFPGQTHFVNFVDKALIPRHFPLKVFFLFSDTVSDRSRIHTWILTAIKLRVEKLHVRLYGELLEYVLPSCVFNCETLIEFRLFMSHELRLPSLICLENLKVLTLAWVDIRSDSSAEKLLLPCPSLEQLSLINCKWRRLKALQISAPKLLRLNIMEHPLHEGLESDFYLGIHGARIESITYTGRFIHRYIISGSSSLVVARIGITFDWPHTPPHNAYHGYELLKDLSSVKRLSLENTNEFLLHERSDLLKSLPVFPNLTELKINAIHPFLSENRFLVVMLHKCPNLSHLEFNLGIYAESETADMIFNHVPHCFLSSLKVIRICNIEAGDEQLLAKALLAMRILLRTARVLEKLFIFPQPMRLAGNLLQLLNELSRASDRCEILLGV